MSSTPAQPELKVAQSPEYREIYANSVQVRVTVWDFQLIFGTASSESPDQVNIRNQAAVFLSPQQAKALFNVSDGSIPATNQILLNLFGQGYVTDGLNLTMTYTFPTALTPVQYAIVLNSGVLPRPPGVSTSVVQG